MENEVKQIRCAIYTRKSTDENLDAEFTTLDAQREACENYIRSQVSKKWQILPDRYDDGGYSGGDTNRPALQRMMADIRAGQIDIVVVYKIDRLSRAIIDFGELQMEFEKKRSFLCVGDAGHQHLDEFGADDA